MIRDGHHTKGLTAPPRNCHSKNKEKDKWESHHLFHVSELQEEKKKRVREV